MTEWEQKIVEACISRYFASAPETNEERVSLRIRSSSLFPGFDTAQPDEKESYLEAAESLERKGIVKLHWEKRGRGERLKSLSCEDFGKLFEEAGIAQPKNEAEKIRAMIFEKAKILKESSEVLGKEANQTEKLITLLDFLSIHFGLREIGQGIDQQAMEDLIRLLEFSSVPFHLENITIRALSILLYRDSKRLENIVTLCSPLLSRVQKSTAFPDPVFPKRSFPEALIAGKISIVFKSDKQKTFFNDDGHIFGFPLETVEKIDSIGYAPGKNKHRVLTIENKETFYALANPLSHGTDDGLPYYDCFLYTGGYPNQAVAALIKILVISDFTFFHAGDLDPDGVLILQNITDIAQRPVTPIHMDTDTFDRYQPWARPLAKTMLRQISKIREETQAIPGLNGLLRRIEETGLGVEQEIIDYR